ncbi:unnamed protein product [Chrysoparadoxa australica]
MRRWLLRPPRLRSSCCSCRWWNRAAPHTRALSSSASSSPPGGLELSTGYVAALADGAVIARQGGTTVLTSAVANWNAADETGFLPLTVDYREKAHAAGRIPNTRDRRDGMATEEEILVSRAIDRVIRPLFPKGMVYETQIVSTVQSLEDGADPVVLAINGASAALCASSIPWDGPVGCVRVGKIKGRLVVNPPPKLLEHKGKGTLDLLYAGNADRSLMIEMGGGPTTEAELTQALKLAQSCVRDAIQAQSDLAQHSGDSKCLHHLHAPSQEMVQLAFDVGYVEALLCFSNATLGKAERGKEEGRVMASIKKELCHGFPDASGAMLAIAADDVMREAMRDAIMSTEIRCDGRAITDVRSLDASLEVAPMAHGSALFTRGQTQALVTTTLGPPFEAGVDRFVGTTRKELLQQQAEASSLILHYEFPPYSVNEVGRIGGINRRGIGHGNLAEKALRSVMPPRSAFPYTVRVNSEVTMSNGSSSMATACGASLALMDAGVPLASHVAGISIGLISGGECEQDKEEGMDGARTTGTTGTTGTGAGIGQYRLLTDILGTEDHYGDMDLKIAGTDKGITAMQLDVKLQGGVPLEVIVSALERAKVAHSEVLAVLTAKLPRPRLNTKSHAPGVKVVKFSPPNKKKDIIGPGRETLTALEEQYNVKVDLSVDGMAYVYSRDSNDAARAAKEIRDLVVDIEVGDVLEATVTSIKDFGCILEVLRGREGLLHMSEMRHELLGAEPRDLVTVGQTIEVKCIDVDPRRGLFKFSRKALMPLPEESLVGEGQGQNSKSAPKQLVKATRDVQVVAPRRRRRRKKISVGERR